MPKVAQLRTALRAPLRSLLPLAAWACVLAGVGSAAAQSTQTAPAAKPAPKPVAKHVVHHATAAKPAPCPAALLPPPAVPANLPPAPGAVQAVYALRFVDMAVGTGDEALPGEQVALTYTGWLASDGTKFDSSFDHPDKAPIRLQLGAGRVIPGWDTGIVGMKQGGKRRLFIPYQLAYGLRGRPPVIPEKSDLIFDVELVEVTPAAAPGAGSGFARPPAPATPPAPPRPSTPPAPPAPPQ